MSEIDNFNAMENAFKDKKSNENLDDLSAYENLTKPEPPKPKFVPPDNIPMNMGHGDDDIPKQKPLVSENVNNQQFQYDDEGYYDEDDNGFKEPPRPDKINQFDEQLFPGGPMYSELESWKKQYPGVWIVDDLPDQKIYIYRTLSRYEYKGIMATPNTDPLMREEMICEQCVLFPYEYSYGMMSNNAGGVPTVLAQHIMETSGFTKASMPKRL